MCQAKTKPRGLHNFKTQQTGGRQMHFLQTLAVLNFIQ